MTATGEYAVVTYSHPLRGERINLGVVVWHPLHGSASRFVSNLGRAHTVDESANAERIRRDIDEIEAFLREWSDPADSPLKHLARQFSRGLTVNDPSPARMSDPTSMLERLTSCLLPPAPFMRASSARQFSQTFARRIGERLRQSDEKATDIREDYMELDTFQPVKITISYAVEGKAIFWRATSFASLSEGEPQLLLAKAMYAENHDLRALSRYNKAHVNVAVQLPKPSARGNWRVSADWLQREVDRVEVFEDRVSVDSKAPSLILT